MFNLNSAVETTTKTHLTDNILLSGKNDARRIGDTVARHFYQKSSYSQPPASSRYVSTAELRLTKVFKYLVLVCVLSACNLAVSDSPKIVDFESCVAAGNPVLRSYPAKCAAPGIGTFTEKINQAPEGIQPGQEVPKIENQPICKDLCGDGVCAEMVCMAQGCPCSESAASCPKDCH